MSRRFQQAAWGIAILALFASGCLFERRYTPPAQQVADASERRKMPAYDVWGESIFPEQAAEQPSRGFQ